MLTRREAVTVGLGAPLLASACRGDVKWTRRAYRKPASSRVAIVRAAAYGPKLVDEVLAGLRLLGVTAQNRRVVLKPNLVEFDPGGAINTHPAVVAAAVGAFRRLGAREVVVAEGPGHRRDTEYLLTASGLHAVLRDLEVRYVDLNRAAVTPVELG
ncbi:MAG TPA: DUF362 domain-containing protein, partial [Candidatus Tectomicrobia bacterium]|nr:DUF362 domain-containing protein [Candidatus Tectomicrobia bacterium]